MCELEEGIEEEYTANLTRKGRCHTLEENKFWLRILSLQETLSVFSVPLSWAQQQVGSLQQELHNRNNATWSQAWLRLQKWSLQISDHIHSLRWGGRFQLLTAQERKATYHYC